MSTIVKLSISTIVLFVVLGAISAAMPTVSAVYLGSDPGSGDIVWIILCSALVLLMVPGIAFFYGGMLRKQSMTSIMAQCIIALGVMTLSWFMFGYTLAFGAEGGFIGNFDHVFLNGLDDGQSDYSELMFAVFQGMFAAVTAAIVLGACAERVRFNAMVWFLAIWGIVVYVPMAHLVWGFGFDSFGLTVLDFAGGDAVHICSAVSGLAIVMFVGKRAESTRKARPHNIPFAFFGAMLLWIGWFGFNGGSGLYANGQAIHVITVTMFAAAAGMVAWAICQYVTVGRIGVLGLIAGAIAGLVAITPGAGYVGTPESFVIGVIGGVLCFFAVRFIHSKDKFDDALDVFGIHGVGGIWGGIATGLFAEARFSDGINGLFFGGIDLFIGQIVAILFTLVFCFVVSYVVIFLLSKIIQVRVPAEEESIGQDIVEHGEPSYY